MLADLLDRHAQRWPDKPAFVDGARMLTYAQLRDTARALAAGLHDLGLPEGSHVALLTENRSEFPVLVAAAAYGGFTLAPVNVRLHPQEQRMLLDDCRARLVFVEDRASAAQLAAQARLIELGSDDFHLLLERGRPAAPQDRPAAAALVMYATGGTSGLPKWCQVSDANLAAQARNFADAIGLCADDRYGLFMPFFHMACGGMVIALMMAGATGVLLPRRDRAALIDTLERACVTRTNLPALVLRELAEAGLLRRLPALQWLGTGNGTPLELQQELARRVCADVWGWYGQTEATNITASPRSTAEAQSGPGCIGQPAFTARVRIVDEQGRDVPDGVIGELWTAGPHVMLGYWQRPEESAAAFCGEWLRSGDLVRRDANGSLYLMDRLKDIIKSGSETICSRELEIVLERHPSIAEAAVIAVPHPRWGESPRAIVVTRPERQLSAAEVVAHCGEHLAGFKRPTSVVFAPSLPRNVAGKVRKDLLRRDYAAPSSEGIPEQ